MHHKGNKNRHSQCLKRKHKVWCVAEKQNTHLRKTKADDELKQEKTAWSRWQSQQGTSNKAAKECKKQSG